MKLTQPFSVYIMKSAHQDYFDDGSSLTEKLTSIRDKNETTAKFSNNTYNMTPHLTSVTIDQLIRYPYQSASMDFKLAASYASFAQMRKVGGIETGNWVKITRHTLDYFAQQFPEIAGQLMSIKDKSIKDSNEIILNNSNLVAAQDIEDVKAYISQAEQKILERNSNIIRDNVSGRLDIVDEKNNFPENYVIQNNKNSNSPASAGTLSTYLKELYNLQDNITAITEASRGPVILEQTIFFGIIDTLTHSSVVDEETGTNYVMLNITCRSFLEPIINSQIAPFHVMEFTEYDKETGKQKILEKFMSSLGFLGNARDEVDYDNSINREEKFKNLYSDILSQYIVDPVSLNDIIVKIRQVSGFFAERKKGTFGNPEALKNTLSAMLKGLSTKFLPLGLQPSSLADPIKRNNAKMINSIRVDRVKKQKKTPVKMFENKNAGNITQTEIEERTKLINPNGLLTLGMILNVATSQKDIPRANTCGYEQFMPLTDIPLFPKGLLLSGGNLQPTTIWNLISNMFVTDDNIIELFPILIPLTKKIEYNVKYEDKELPVNQDVPNDVSQRVDDKGQPLLDKIAGGGRGQPNKYSDETKFPRYLLERYTEISNNKKESMQQSFNILPKGGGWFKEELRRSIGQKNLPGTDETAPSQEINFDPIYITGDAETTPGFNTFIDNIPYQIVPVESVSQDFNLSNRTNEAIIDFYNELGAVPTIIFRLKPLDPDVRITKDEINSMYKKANDRRLQALKDLKSTGFNPSIPAYFYDELKDKTYSEQLSATAGIGINLNQDSCFSRNLPYIEIDELIDFQVTQLEDKRINAVYVESDVITVNAGSATVSFNTSPILDDRDIIINGLRLYKTEFPFNVNSDELIAINQINEDAGNESVKTTENTFKLPSAIAERIYTLYGRNSEKVEGTFKFKGHEFLDILCGSWLCLRTNRNKLHQGLNLNPESLNANSDIIDFYCYVNKVSSTFQMDDLGNMIKLTTVVFERGKWGTLNIPQLPTHTFSQRFMTKKNEEELENEKLKNQLPDNAVIDTADVTSNPNISVFNDESSKEFDFFENLHNNLGIHEQIVLAEERANNYDIVPFRSEEDLKKWYSDNDIDLGDQPAGEAYELEKANELWELENARVLGQIKEVNSRMMTGGQVLSGRILGTNKELIALGLTYNTFGPYDADSDLFKAEGLTQVTEIPGFEDGIIDEYDIQNNDFIDELNDIIIQINDDRVIQGFEPYEPLSEEEATAIRLINGVLP